MNTHARKRIFEKCHILQKQLQMCITGILLLFSASLCEDFSDLTRPTSNHVAISDVYDTLKICYYSLFCLILHFYCEIKLSLRLLQYPPQNV